MYRIAFLGPPGSGKGTQAQLLAPTLEVPIVGPGALYRKEIAANSELGQRVRDAVESGGMVPNAITNEVIAKYLREPACVRGYILDGYPREQEQLAALDTAPLPLTHAIYLAIPEAVVYHRLAERLVCICGAQFNRRELALDHGDEARCDACDGALERRKDDDPARIAQRIAHYRAETEPVIASLRERGILVEIDGTRAIAVVHQEIVERIAAATEAA
ncbi:MAG: nucleoside monophosphate kinase [bacterium]|nr:nucleoside monophosphate kinase [bacterium]